jgi:hypothetical protein
MACFLIGSVDKLKETIVTSNVRLISKQQIGSSCYFQTHIYIYKNILEAGYEGIFF